MFAKAFFVKLKLCQSGPPKTNLKDAHIRAITTIISRRRFRGNKASFFNLKFRVPIKRPACLRRQLENSSIVWLLNGRCCAEKGGVHLN